MKNIFIILFVILISFSCKSFYITPILLSLLFFPKPAGYIFAGALLIIAGQPSFIMIKSFVRFLNKKPAIELTSEFYIDHLNGVKIDWKNIKTISSTNYGQWTFLCFDLIDNSIFYRQIKNPIQSLFIKLETLLTKISMKTNISLVKGNNKEIYWTIFNHQKSTSK
jgi:hypothetical protein